MPACHSITQALSGLRAQSNDGFRSGELGSYGIGGQAPGALHHIAIRGIERKAIFKDKQDYHSFLDRMGNLLEESSTACYARGFDDQPSIYCLRLALLPYRQ